MIKIDPVSQYPPPSQMHPDSLLLPEQKLGVEVSKDRNGVREDTGIPGWSRLKTASPKVTFACVP